MSVMVEPDLNFIKGLSDAGAATVKKCYQCATCSVVCNVAPQGGPFPRKEMVWAQWGLKDKLAADPDVWLCHNCGDCSTNCPRGANPAEVLGALRKATVEKYAMVKPLANIANMGLIASMVIPAIIILAILAANGTLNPMVNYSGDGKPLVFNDFFPIHYVDPLFTVAFLFAAASAVYAIKNFWNDICEGAKLGKLTGRNGLRSILPTLGQILTHDVFDKCGTQKGRKLPHMIVLFSFIALFITTNIAVFYLYVMGMKPGEYSSLINPIKWIGNAGAIGLLVGGWMLIANRKANPDKTGSTGSAFDWSLLYLILFIGVTGFGAQMVRIFAAKHGGLVPAAYGLYVLHLISVLTLFIFTPYSKLAHLVYRTTAMVFARHTGKTLGYSTVPAAAPVAEAAPEAVAAKA